MAVLWCGGEDIDFGATGSTPTVDTTSTHFRSTYARCSAVSLASDTRSNAFSGGAVTSVWVSFRMFYNSSGTSIRLFGFRDTGTGGCLMVASSGASATKLALSTWNGTTLTQLATESGTSLTAATLHWVVMQIQNYGASSTVNVWLNGVLLITFTGDCTVASATSVNSLIVGGNALINKPSYSEVIITDVDSRGMVGLMTLALTGAGVNQAWTNPTFSNINATTLTVATPTNSNTAAQETDYDVTNLAVGTFNILACKQTIWAAVSSTPTATQIKMGYNHAGGTAAYGTSSTKTPGVAYGSFEQLDSTDPVSGVAWVQSDMNALQVAYKSA